MPNRNFFNLEEETTTLEPSQISSKLRGEDSDDTVETIEKGFTLYQEAERRSQVGFIIGGCFGALTAIAAVLAVS